MPRRKPLEALVLTVGIGIATVLPAKAQQPENPQKVEKPRFGIEIDGDVGNLGPADHDYVMEPYEGWKENFRPWGPPYGSDKNMGIERSYPRRSDHFSLSVTPMIVTKNFMLGGL